MSESVEKILILGGTKEAVALARSLLSDGHRVTTSLAGRTQTPAPIPGSVRMGGFGGPKGLANYLIIEKIDRLIDATHPFATQISKNAETAAKMVGIKFEIYSRKPWEKEQGDDWLEVTSPDEARDKIPKGARALLALGSQHIGSFKTRDDVFFLVRMIDQPEKPLLLSNHKLLIAKPSESIDEEAAIIKQHNLSHIICRNSGGVGAYAKIAAARIMGTTVIMISRPT